MPRAVRNISYDKGLVTARDPATSGDGELTQAVCCEYHCGSTHLYKLKGRTSTGRAIGSAVRGIVLAQHDTTTDKLVVIGGSSIYEGNAAADPGALAAVAGITLSGTSIPVFTATQDHWIMVDGVNANYVREPNPVNKSGWTSGNWRTLGMQGASGTTTVASYNTTPPSFANAYATSVAGTFTSPTLAVDGDIETSSYGEVASTATSKTHTWNYTSNPCPGASGRVLNLWISQSSQASSGGGGLVTDRNADLPRLNPDENNCRLVVEVSTNNGSTWTTVWDRSGSYSRVPRVFSLTDGVDYGAVGTRLTVRATVTYISGRGLSSGAIHELYVNNGGADSHDIEFGVSYCVAERYTDTDGVVHESPPTKVSESSGARTGVYSITVNLPSTVTNAFATEWVIYRSIDEEGGGFPDMWEVGVAVISATTWRDDLALSLTENLDKPNLLPTLQVVSPSGTIIDAPVNTPPPRSSMALEFQNSIVYIPVDIPRRIYYSLPASLSLVAFEQVPAIYHLEFVSPRNDTVISLARANGGRALLCYFTSYTMLITYLPQASDPGGFDRRVREFVSTSRGTAGAKTACEFTMPNGRTLAASVDPLGLWVTDGVGYLSYWSDDLDWSTLMSGVTLGSGELLDNAEMKRLEFLYTAADGTRKELHFFYARLKEDPDGGGEGIPLVTGPHYIGIRCKHFNVISNAWIGWSGDASATGTIFNERTADSDASNGYDANGVVPYMVTASEQYYGGLSKATLVRFGYPKFSTVDIAGKEVTMVATFVRDGAPAAQTITKLFNIGTDRKVYWQCYSDRMKLQIKDLTATALPPLVGYEFELRDAGEGREK